MAQGVPAAPGPGLARAQDKADGRARRIRHELHGRRIRFLRHDHGPPAALHQRADQSGSRRQQRFDCLRPTGIRASRWPTDFPRPHTLGNYALDPHYPCPMCRAWNLDIQKTLPWGIVMNLGYNGSKGNHLDTMIAPRSPPAQLRAPLHRSRPASASTTSEAASFSEFDAGTVR